LPAGHVIAADDIVALRPAAGLPADRQRDLVGQRLLRPVDAGTPFTAADLASHLKGTEHVA
jgi:sialic acid synthase SpsE